MSRFPILNGIRILLYILAVLTLIWTCIISLVFAQVAGENETGDIEKSARIGAFIVGFIFNLTSALGLVFIAESIKLGLYIEDHLYNIRYRKTSARSSNPLSDKQG